MNLQSTVNTIGSTTTQIIHFVSGEKRTFSGIISDTIKQGEFTKMKTTGGSVFRVNGLILLALA